MAVRMVIGIRAAPKIPCASAVTNCPKAGPPTSYRSALAITTRNCCIRLALVQGAIMASTAPVPPSMNQITTSGLLATSPRLRASSMRFWDGSSVLLESSLSSLDIVQPPPRSENCACTCVRYQPIIMVRSAPKRISPSQILAEVARK